MRFREWELAFGALLTAATVAACGGKALDVGSEESTGVGGAAVGGEHATGADRGNGAAQSPPNQPSTLSPEELAAVQWPEDTPCMAAPGSAKVGTWKGHWPGTSGSENSDVVVQILGLTAAGLPCGTVTIGSGSPPPPVSDADAIYPPSQGGMDGAPGRAGPVISEPWPGYAYRMLHVQASETRLAFTITYQEILRPWCQLQPAVPGSFTCLPDYSYSKAPTPAYPDLCTISGPSLGDTTVPCFKIQYCSPINCFCYDGACDVSLQGQQTAFELHWDGPALEGSVDQTRLIFLDPVD